MRRLSWRVGRLERDLWAVRNGVCSLCGGLGMGGVEIRERGRPPIRPLGCPACRRVGVFKIIQIEVTEDRHRG